MSYSTEINFKFKSIFNFFLEFIHKLQQFSLGNFQFVTLYQNKQYIHQLH